MKMSRALPAALALATVTAMLATQASIGFMRDEGYYFSAGQSYGAWVELLLSAPREALTAAATERFWSYNSEHPGLAKLLFALSHLVFTKWLGWLPDALAYRLPGICFAGLVTYWLAQLGQARSQAAAVLAPLLYWCAERPFLHGHLAAFDVPILALNLGVAVQWARAVGALGPEASDAREQRRRNLMLALVYGAALATKHNAWLFPPVLLAHALLCPPAQRRRGLLALPWLLLSPLVLFATWPLLWHGTLGHLRFWIDFHTHHVHYAWWYLGHLLRAPPFPVEYPVALLALTLPLPAVALLAAALVKKLTDFALRKLSPLESRSAYRTERAEVPFGFPGAATGDERFGSLGLLELGFAAASILPFMLRTTPIFGGIKHWPAAVAFLTPEAAALLIAAAAAAAASKVRWLTEARALALGAAAVLSPGLWQIAHTHPYGTSAYGELAGGIPGAASLGMQRQYWSNNVTAVLPWLNEHAPRGARVFFHEVNFESYRAYQLAGLLRADIQYAGGPHDASYAALQWHREFLWREAEAWTEFETQRPATGFYLDETAQVVVYARKGVPGAR